jgi:hypothetical protein
MSGRIEIAGVSERDMDLLLLEEFQSSQGFQQWFIRQVLGKDARLGELISAQRSITQSIGESDLEIAFADPSGGQVRFLIENKVNAGFQPEQAKGYRKRGDSYVTQKHSASCHTVIVAPARYFGEGESTKGFDKKITYEAVRDWFAGAAELGERRKYKLALLQSAIDKGTVGYQPVEDRPVTEFWRAYWLFAREHAPELEMSEPSQSKPSGSSFVYFRPHTLQRGVEICHKLTKGYVDLQINHLGKRLNELHHSLSTHLRNDVTLKQAGQSAAIRIDVPVLDLSRPFAEQVPQVQVGLTAALDHLHWFLEKQPFMPNYVLQPTPSSGRG